MNSFDLEFINLLNQFSNLSQNFDLTVRFISSNYLVKSGILLSLIWWAWFNESSDRSSARIHCVSTLVGCVIAIAIGRALALLLPFRLRPIHNENLDFLVTYGMNPDLLDGWSSFPSDHAVLFYSISAGLYYISKKLGLFAFFYTTVFIALPRVYLGLHFPTDIVAGALIGFAIAVFCNAVFFQEKVCRPVIRFSAYKPEFFYPLFFLVTYQIADMFNSSREVLRFLYAGFKAIFG